MTKQANPATKPLEGTRILIGRARHQAGSLSSQLRAQGAQVLEIPFIEIRKPRNFEPLDTALKNLKDYDWLILTSVNGVEATWERVAKVLKGRGLSRAARRTMEVGALAPEGRILRVVAIGPATKKAI